jgi:hypothetical protein
MGKRKQESDEVDTMMLSFFGRLKRKLSPSLGPFIECGKNISV